MKDAGKLVRHNLAKLVPAGKEGGVDHDPVVGQEGQSKTGHADVEHGHGEGSNRTLPMSAELDCERGQLARKSNVDQPWPRPLDQLRPTKPG
jgi:hypothetical protein